MSKWAVTADLHFGMYSRYSEPLPDGRTGRLKDIAECWTEICKVAEDRGCKGIIVLGDVIEARDSVEIPVIHQVCESFSEAHEMGLEVIVVAGNHDSYLRNPSMLSLRMIQEYAEVITQPHVRKSMAFVPWTDDHDQYRRWVQEVSGARFLFSHILLDEAGYGDDFPSEFEGFDSFETCIFGDVHEPIELSCGMYAGAPLQHTYRDAGSRRGFWILNIKKSSYSLEFVENTVSPRFHTIESSEDIPKAKVQDGDFVRIRSDDVEPAQIDADATIEREATPDDEEVLPRLRLTSSEGHRKILSKYLDHMGIQRKRKKKYVKIGLDILNEVSE